MSRLDSVQQLLAVPNGRKKFVQQIPITSVKSITTLLFADEYGIPFQKGECLVLQANVDFSYKLQPASGTSQITQMSGAHPGIYIPALQQEYVYLHGNAAAGAATWGPDTQIEIIAASDSGVVNVWFSC